MLPAGDDLRACLNDGPGELIRLESGQTFVGLFRSQVRDVELGGHTVQTLPASIFAPAAEVPPDLVKQSKITRANGDVWFVKDIEPDDDAGAIVIVLKR